MIKSNNITNSIISSMIFCLSLLACDKTENHTSAIRILDSLSITIDSSLAQLNVSASQDSYKPDTLVQYIQSRYVGVMKQEMAFILSEHARSMRKLESTKEDLDGVLPKADTIKLQITNLKKALTEHATHDSKQNEITKDYVVKCLQQETYNVNELLEYASELTVDYNQTKELWQSSFPIVQHWADSLAKRRH